MTNNSAANAAAIERAAREIGAAASVPEDVQGAMLAWAQGFVAGRASGAGQAEKEGNEGNEG